MEKKQKGKVMKVLGAIGIGTVLLGGGVIAGAQLFPQTITHEKILTEYVDVLVDRVVEVPVEVEVQVERIVEVSDGKLDLVLQHIYDNKGQVEYLTEDLDDYEVSMIADRIVFINDVKTLAVQAIKDELFDELDGEMVGTVKLDDRDMKKLRINDNHDELIISDVDFEDGDAEVTVTGRFSQDDVKYNFEVIVNFKDGEYDDMDIVSITEA